MRKSRNGFRATRAVGGQHAPLTQTAFVRILSNPAFSPDALTLGDAVALLRANLGHPGHRFWAVELSCIHVLEPLTPRLAGHQQVTDAYSLGLAMHKKARDSGSSHLGVAARKEPQP